jgi:hypothetical protein
MIVSIFDEEFNDRCEALLDKLYLNYHAEHYAVGRIDMQSFTRRYQARQARKEIRAKQLKLIKKGKHGRQ